MTNSGQCCHLVHQCWKKRNKIDKKLLMHSRNHSITTLVKFGEGPRPTLKSQYMYFLRHFESCFRCLVSLETEPGGLILKGFCVQTAKQPFTIPNYIQAKIGPYFHTWVVLKPCLKILNKIKRCFLFHLGEISKIGLLLTG